MSLNSNLTSMSSVTENAPVSPAYLNAKFNVYSDNINSLNASTQSFTHLSATTLSLLRSGKTGDIYIDGSGSLVVSHSGQIRFTIADTDEWVLFGVSGTFLPARVVSATVGRLDVGLVSGGNLRALFTNHIVSLATMATMSVLSVGEIGLVQQASGLSLVARSGDTYYDMGSGTSIGV